MNAAPPNTPSRGLSTISVVVPLFNERAALDELYGRLSAVLREFAHRYEIIFVDDGSTDGSSDNP